MATGLVGAGLGFINGMNAAYTHANKSDKDKFPQWFKDMKGWGASADKPAPIEERSLPSSAVATSPEDAPDMTASIQSDAQPLVQAQDAVTSETIGWNAEQADPYANTHFGA